MKLLNLRDLNKFSVLSRYFYENSPEVVAKKLLGKILVRRFNANILAGRIVETEAYYGKGDPASRAYKGINKISELMFGNCGKLLVYMVHANYLVNVISHPLNEVGAVLIRAAEPIMGANIMKINRGLDKDLQLCSGPGKLTKAFGIDKSHHGLDISKKDSEVIFINDKLNNNFEIVESFRIGVKKDLPKKLRFYIKNSSYVSKK